MSATAIASVHPFPHGITQIDAEYVQPGVASVYLLRQGEHLAIIETGTANSIAGIRAAIENMGLTLDNVDYVIPTHIHLDHAAGAGTLMQLCPNAQLVIHPRGASHMIDPSKLEAGTRAVYGDEAYDRLYGALQPIDPDRVLVADDNYQIDFAGRTLCFLDTPGHALHHFCVHDSLSNSVFSGDTFGIAYPNLGGPDGAFLFVTTTPVHFDPEAMRRSIERICALQPAQVYLTHYGPIELTATHVAQLLESLDAFVSIAQAQPAGDARAADIESGLMQWLLQQHRRNGSTLATQELENWLKTDANLNAQGLEVWLKRQEKLAAH